MSDTIFHIPRHCREHSGSELADSKLLSDYRNAAAYVLLGEQGAGKSESFKFEVKETGGVQISARDFINGLYGDLNGKTIFIDGVDEIRSGSLDGRLPFDQIRKRLFELGSPTFRLSCREADWYGSSDEDAFKQVSPNQEIKILRLEPLDHQEIKQAISNYVPELDIEWFINGLEKNGLGSLLGNPQLLKMLAQSCRSNAIPDSRQQAYELACSEMVRETNAEHLTGQDKLNITAEEVIDCAGKYCAHLLLADVEGFSLTSTESKSVYPFYKEVSRENTELTRFSLKSLIFKSGSKSEQREPVHRTVAEYLAARYLARQIDSAGLPVGRLLALMSSSDQIVTSLRGLYGWLAILSNTESDTLLRLDPLGIILYGDPAGLNRDQKIILLEGLKQEAIKNPRFRNQNWQDYPFGALASPDMEQTFRRILSDNSRTFEHQALADCVMDALEYGEPVSGLSEELLSIVKDKYWFSGIRRTAWKILLRNLDKAKPDQIQAYLTITDQLRDGGIEDSDRDLLGLSLKFLYPEFIKPKTVLDYFFKAQENHYFGLYHYFWVEKIVENSSGDHVMILLDELVSRSDLKKQMFYDQDYQNMAGRLLVKGIKKHGDDVSTEHLYKWLGIGCDQYSTNLDQKEIVVISEWLTQRPVKYKEIFKEGSSECDDKEGDQYSNCLYKAKLRLFEAHQPEKFSQWLLGQASSSQNKQFGIFCFQEVVRIFYSGKNPDMSLDGLIEWLGSNKEFQEIYDEMSVDWGVDERLKRAVLRSKTSLQRDSQKKEWMQYLLTHKEDIAEGKAYPSIYQDLGRAYSGNLNDAQGDAPEERLANLFGDEHSYMVDYVFKGLAEVINREDLPTPKQILDLRKEGRNFYLEFAVLAGMRHLYYSNETKLLELSDTQIKSAITFYLVHATGSNAEWMHYLFKNRTELAAETYTQYVIYMLKAKQNHIYGSYACAYTEEWKGIAKLSALKILSKFPLRSSVEQALDLEYYLKASLRYSNAHELLELVQDKLSKKSLDDAQRVKWMAAALILDAKEYENEVNNFLGKSSKRILSMAGFFGSRIDQWKPEFDLPPSSLSMLIKNIAAYVNPYSLFGGTGNVTADVVGLLISKLAESVDIKAADEFEKLINNPELNKWHLTLRDKLYELRKRINESEFIKPSLTGVINTLSNQAPANPADLMSLTLVILRDQACKIKNDSSNLYNHYWNYPQDKTRATPKTENECRDILKSQIEPRFQQLNLQVIKESYYVEDKRADFTFLYGQWNLPVEIKKDVYNQNANDNVWTSLWNQLIKNYARDPQAYGYGIYLIFWFGQGKVRVSPNGQKPTSAKEMEEMILEMMSDEERKRIGLCVIDCSLPVK